MVVSCFLLYDCGDKLGYPLQWNPLVQPYSKAENSQAKSHRPDRDIFGQLKVKIAEAEKSVMDIQITFESSPSDALLLDLSSAKSSLHNCLNVESAHWKQRAKIRWLRDGNKNISCLHLSTTKFIGFQLVEISLKMKRKSETKRLSFFSNLL